MPLGCQTQILMLKGRRHAFDLGFGEIMPCGFIAPLRDGLANLLCYVAGFAGVEIEVPRDFQCQSE